MYSPGIVAEVITREVFAFPMREQNAVDHRLQCCDLKEFFAANRSNSLPLVFEKAKSLTP
jgi:hypothetical protein